MNILNMSAIAVIVCAVAIVLKKENKELALCVSLIGGVIFLLTTLNYIEPIFEQLSKLSGTAKVDNSIFTMVLKATGICLISGFACETCRDCNENNLAAQLEVVTRAVILVLCLPIITNIINEFMRFTEV